MSFESLGTISDDEFKKLNVDLSDQPGLEIKKEDPKKEDPLKEEKPKVEEDTVDQALPNQISSLSEEDLKNLEIDEDGKPKNDNQKPTEDNVNFGGVYQMLVDKGIWSPVRGEKGEVLENPELTQEQFADLWEAQAKWKIEDAQNEYESKYGPQLKTLLEHLENGGKVEDLASTYKEESNIQDMDVSDPDQAEKLIRIHCEAMDWSDKRINLYINSLKDQGVEALSEIAGESKEQLVKSIEEQRASIIEEQKLQEKRRRDHQERFSKNIKDQIYKDGIPEREKKELEKFFFDHKNPVDGGKATDFYLKMQDIQSDPAKYYKFIQFVKNFENFDNVQKIKKEERKNTWNLLKTGEKLHTSDSESPERKAKEEKKVSPFSKF